MISDLPTLTAALQARGLLPDQGSTPDVAASEIARPWWLGLLLGASGWLAGLFTLGFVATLFQPRGATDAAVASAVLLAAAWGLYRADRDGAFASQLALALSIAGQCLLVYALNVDATGLAGVAASTLAVQVVLAAVMPNPAHRTLSAFFATLAWAVTVRATLFGTPSFWHGLSGPAPALPAALGGWALTWLPMGGAIGLALYREADWMARGGAAAWRPVLDGLIVGLACATLVSDPLAVLQVVGIGGPAQGWLALWPLLSALAALGGVAAGHALQSRALMAGCAAGALLHVTHAYYVLGISLLQKSALMGVVGVALWLAARQLRRPGARPPGPPLRPEDDAPQRRAKAVR